MSEAENVLTNLEIITPALLNIVIEKAKEGDMSAIKLILDRTFPVRKMRNIFLNVDKIESIKDVEFAMKKVVLSTLKGFINADEAKSMMDVLKYFKEAIIDLNLSEEFLSFKAATLSNEAYKRFNKENS